MAIKSFKPYTPSRRNMTVSAFDGVDKKAKPVRSLLDSVKKNSGRNSYGRITVRHRGGGNKRKYRIIDFKRDKIGSATVLRLEYDPNRSANIALIVYVDGEKAELTPKEYEILFYFVKNRGIALTREKLLMDVWGFDFYGDDRTVDTHIKMLRSNLKQYRKFIVTLRGLGDKFEV